MPNNFLIDIIDPLNPSGPKIKAAIPHEVYLRFYKFSPVKYENLVAGKFVLENPERIFSGVRVYNEGGWCFTGRPKTWLVKEDLRVPFPAKLIFAVYLNPAYNLYEIRAEPCAPDDPFSPENWQDRYSALVWKKTTS